MNLLYILFIFFIIFLLFFISNLYLIYKLICHIIYKNKYKNNALIYKLIIRNNNGIKEFNKIFEIKQKLKQIISFYTFTIKNEINNNSLLKNLGFDKITIISLLLDIENEFNININKTNIIFLLDIEKLDIKYLENLILSKIK